MLSAHTPVDITVQRLLLSDPHLRDTDVFQSIELLVERSEIPHLEQIVVSMQQQLQKNWPSPQWQIALSRLTSGPDLRKAESVIAILEPTISLLIRRAVNRLQSVPSQMTKRTAEHIICSTKVAA